MIGRFAGLSCSDVVNINSYYNNTKYSYLMYKNGSGINIDKLSETHGDCSKTCFKNGLEVSVSVHSKVYELTAAIEKLVLFEKLHITYINKYNNYSGYSYDILADTINSFNTRKIDHYKTFSITNLLSSDRYLKVGNIIYCNKDWDNFETTGGIIIDIPIGEVDITPNREELQFTSRTKQAIAYHISEVKKELQEIVDNIQSKDFTLKEFYNYSTNDYIQYTNKNVLNIDKRDVSINSNICIINGKNIPYEFDAFINCIKGMYLNPEGIYKVYNSGVYYRHRRIIKTAVYFDSILDEGVYLAVKKDAVTKAITTEWFKSTIGSDCVVVVYDIDKVKTSIKEYLKGIVVSFDEDACIEFLFDNLSIKTLANDYVPQSYIDSYKAERKKVSKAVNTTEVPIRLYIGSHIEESIYTLTTLKEVSDYFIIYSTNTKEDSKIRKLANLLHPLSMDVKIITMKKEDIPSIESNSRFMSLDDFLELPNTILKKIVTISLILKNFSSSLTFLDNKLPIIVELKAKYYKYAQVCETSAYKEEFIKDLLSSYESRGWYNKADVEYFKISPEEEEAIKVMAKMKENKDEIVRCMAFFMFGKKDKIGLGAPKINICKYLKKFKYECI